MGEKGGEGSQLANLGINKVHDTASEGLLTPRCYDSGVRSSSSFAL